MERAVRQMSAAIFKKKITVGENGWDNPTSGKISIPQLVSVAEQTGLSNTWSQPQYLCQHACVSTLHAN